MRALFVILMIGNTFLVLVVPLVLGAIFAIPRNRTNVWVWLTLGVVLVLTTLVPWYARRLLRRPPPVREWYEDPPVLLALASAALLLPLTWQIPYTTPVVSIGVYTLARRICPAEPSVHNEACANCGFDARGNLTETCPECGFTTVVLGHYRGRWMLVVFGIDEANQGGSLGIGLRGPGVAQMHTELRIPHGPGAIWVEAEQTMWLLNTPDDLRCFHHLQHRGQSLLPRAILAAPFLSWHVNPEELEKQEFASVLADNRAALART